MGTPDRAACERCAALEAQVAELTARLETRKAYLRRQRTRGKSRRRREAARTNSESLARAVNFSKEWTGPELELASRDNLTVREIAARLGRTYYAVATMRKLLRSERGAQWRQLRDGPVPPASVSGTR